MRLSDERRLMVEQNQGLAYQFAKNYAKTSPYEHDEILGSALMALCVAAEKYRPETGWKFSTYAVASMKRYVWRYLIDTKLVRVPVHHYDREPNPRAKYTAQAAAAMNVTHFGSMEDTESLVTIEPDFGASLDTKNRIKWLKGVLRRKLAKRDRDIALKIAAGESLCDLAAKYGVTRQRIAQINDRAIETLRKHANAVRPRSARSNQHSI